MPTNEEPKQDPSAKDQAATPELEKKAEEIQSEDADTISGGFGRLNGGE
jgi:hypothetical protein